MYRRFLMDIYVVQPGDDIFAIAEKYGVTVTRLIQDNGLENPYDLVIGQTIVIAYPKQTHTVQQGDSLTSIAEAYGIPLMKLLRNNPFLLDREYIYPDETIVISYNTIGKIATNGFTYPYINTNTLKKALLNLTYLSVYNYRVTEEGDITAYYDDSEIIQLAKIYGVIPLMMTTTLTPQGEPNMEAAYNVLSNEEYQYRNIDNMINVIKTKGFYGVNIIFNFLNSENQKLYLDYLSRVSERFSREGFLLIITINNAILNTSSESPFEQLDFLTISQLVNNIVFLNLTWGTKYGPPSPISSIYNIRIFLDYLITTVSPDKILLGTSLISYDWELPYIAEQSSVHSLTLYSSLRLANDVDATILFDVVSQTPYFHYNQYSLDVSAQHIVWSIDARSIDSLNKLGTEYEINGTGLWNIMIYYPQLWLLFYSQYEIHQYIPDSLI